MQRLQQSGDLQQVVGSQSMLSQELFRPSQIEDDFGDEDVVAKARSSLLNQSYTSASWRRANSENQLSQFKDDETGDTCNGHTSTSKDDIASVLLSLPNTQLDDNSDEGMMMGLDAMKHAASNHLFKTKGIKIKEDRQGTEEIAKTVMDTHDEDKPLSQTSLGSLLDAIQIVSEQDQQAGQDVTDDTVPESQATAPVSERPKRRRVVPKHLEESSSPLTLPTKSARKNLKATAADFRKLHLPLSNRNHASPTKPVPDSFSFCSTKSRIEVAKCVFPQDKPGVSQHAGQEPPKPVLKPPILKLPSSSSAVIHVDDAAELATKIINDAELAKELLLSMALCRTNPRTPPESVPGPGHVLVDGFFWSRYPPLEAVLKDYMPEYYRLSIEKCQSCQQQSFNNRLVDEVTATATERGWIFDPDHFTDVKVLRDRIRCYYKTHIQNAKKRLKTMLRNPTKKSNAIHLREHYDLIQQAAQKKLEADEDEDNPSHG